MTLTPFQAVLSSMLVPGSAHIAFGRPLRGVLVLVTTVGLFFLGYALVGDRLWYNKWFDPFDTLAWLFQVFPLHLWPEWPNLGCSMVASFLRAAPTDEFIQLNAMREMYLPRPWEHIGFFCTASSGILAAIWATEAFLLAKHSERPLRYRRLHPTNAALCSWLLPGSGHYLLGQRDKGILVGAAVVIMFTAGLLFAAGHAVDRVDSPKYFIGTVLFGGGTLFSSLVTAPLEMGERLSSFYEAGTTLVTVAGLMNLVVMIDAYTIAEHDCEPATAEVTT